MQPLDADDPRVIGEYRLLRRLGAGGMGRVYLGRSPGGRTVAVKAVHPRFAADDEFRERFRREVDAARRVGAAPPGGGLAWTAPVLGADPDARVPWVATEYVAGPTLQQAVADHGPLPETCVRALGSGLAEALAAVHGLGLVHRDVKPSNVLLTLDGPRLIDFGISRATDGTSVLTSTGVSIGSPGYMSPEQVLGKGQVGPASDVFSMGAVLAYAATGGSPFPGDSSAALLYLVVHEEPELDGLAGELRELVAECLAKKAGDRPDPASAAARLVGPAVAGASALIRPGWLPGPLVEQVSRSAVELLNLEPETPDEAASGLVPFTHSSRSPAEEWPGAAPGDGTDVRPPAGRWPTPAGAEPVAEPGPAPAGGGAFGPPDPSAPPAQSPSAQVPAVPAQAQSPVVPPGLAPVPPPPEPPPPPRRGRFSVSANATTSTAANPDGRPRGRQLSCTLVLSVAGALAVALITGTFVFDLLPGGGGANESGKDNGGQPPGVTEPPSPTPSAEPTAGDVPAAFLGKWRGSVKMDSGLPGGTLTVTFKNGAKGDRIAQGKVELAGLSCPGSWKLTSASSDKLRTDGSSPSNVQGCTNGSTNEEFTLRKDGTIRYESNDDAGGNVAGTLRKIG
ncbi:serine/threonine protein kinase [Streptomyces armeniacus]|uniref:Serine/threonine protein kinase n=1 Tax=Streptomyces armeniacus TaxID=83291 RepID=A0A345XN43_9ACTN|nr:serine/threonine-protein kinase [Streptomyces armeniacus]AXK33059.1 serine/threonine protein kinase [Streptomyces armeniacus]